MHKYKQPKERYALFNDFENILLSTKDSKDMLSYYAFHGVKSTVSMHLGYCRRKLQIDEQSSDELKPEYVVILERLAAINFNY